MKYTPHILVFSAFLFLGFAIAGVIPFLLWLRTIGALACLFICLLVVEALTVKHHIKAAAVDAMPRYLTVVVQDLLRGGDVATVDTHNRTVTRVVS